MNFSDLFEGVETLNEVDYRDLLPKAFEDFRKRYAALVKQGQGADLYVQFTSKDNAMDRTAVQKPDHADFVGTYAYPIGYVLSHPADIWYGRGARYLRVIRCTTNRILRLDAIQSEPQVYRLMGAVGYDQRTAGTIIGLIKKHYKDRIGGSNKFAKLFLQSIQVDMQSTPTKDDSWGKTKFKYRIRSGQEQSALIMKAGYDAVEDQSRTNKQAVINDREPEQICFLTRGAFRVIEVVPLRPGVEDKKLPGLTHASPDAPVTERPFAQALANILDGDKLKDGPERSSLNGWSYYWTVKGRRVEVAFAPYDGYYVDKNIGQKNHRQDKLQDPNETSVVIRTELGDIQGTYDRKVRFPEIIKDLAQDWTALKKNPHETAWKPQNLAGYHQAKKDEATAYYRAKIEKENQRTISELPQFYKDAEWAAQHFGLPFTPPKDVDTGIILHRACNELSRVLNNNSKNLDAAIQTITNHDFEDAKQAALPNWEELTQIMKAAWAELSNKDDFWWVEMGGSDMFQSMRKILKGWRPKDGEAPDYEPV